MGFWRTNARFQVALQLLPALEAGEEILVGGQAVLEGVMMRSPHAWGIAVRKASGEVVRHSEPLERPSEKHKWMGWPILRGVMTLGLAMTLGYKALRFSANVALEELSGTETTSTDSDKPAKKLEISGWLATLNIIMSLAFFIFMYKFVPLAIATGMTHVHPAFTNWIVFNVVDSAVRIGIFLLFIWGVSLFPDIKRVYQYHGAEHKTVFAFEASEGKPVDIPTAQSFVTWHPRCGTSFLMTVMLISMVFYILLPVPTFWMKFALRIVLLPVIAGVSYEIIRFAAKHQGSLFALMTAPGLWLQRITTQPPSDEQVQCAIVALDEAMVLEAQRGGELVIA